MRYVDQSEEEVERPGTEELRVEDEAAVWGLIYDTEKHFFLPLLSYLYYIFTFILLRLCPPTPTANQSIEGRKVCLHFNEL